MILLCQIYASEMFRNTNKWTNDCWWIHRGKQGMSCCTVRCPKASRMSTGSYQVWHRTFSRPWSAVYPVTCEMALTPTWETTKRQQTFLCEVFHAMREHIFLDRLIIKTATWELRGKQLSSCFYISRQKETVVCLESLRKSMVHRPFWCIIQQTTLP